MSPRARSSGLQSLHLRLVGDIMKYVVAAALAVACAAKTPAGATGDTAGPTSTSPSPPAGPSPDSWLAIVSGTLTDPPSAQTTHDTGAQYAESAAQSLG